MKRVMIMIVLAFSLVGCSPKDTGESPGSSLPKTNQTTGVNYIATVADLADVQVNQVYRHGTCQEQGMFVFDGESLKVYKKYTLPNPNLSATEFEEETAKLLSELGLSSMDEFEEVTDNTYEDCVVTVEEDKYFVEADGFSETFEKVGPNRIKDQSGVEYEVIK